MESSNNQYKFITFLSMLYITAYLCAFILAYKIVPLFGLILSAGIFIFPITYNISDIFTEVYGYSRSRRLIWESILCQFIFVIIITLVIYAPSAPEFHGQAAFQETLGHLFRFFIAIIAGITVGAFINIYLISKLKLVTSGRYFAIRSFISSALAELVVSLITDSIAFSGIYSFHEVVKIMISVYIFKLIYLIALLPITVKIANKLKKIEKTDVFDTDTNFNPFSLKVD